MQKMVDIGHLYTTTYLQSGIHLPSCIKHLIAFPDTVDSGIFKFITPGNNEIKYQQQLVVPHKAGLNNGLIRPP